jgi:tRNA dimethylallyltransferase
VVGGTGFFIRALIAPLFAAPPLDATRRQGLSRALASMSTLELRRWCERLDPTRSALGRAQLLRAIEIALLTGVPISRWHRATARAPRLRAEYLIVDPGPALDQRIAARVHAMLAAGWEEEVQELARRIPDDAPAWNATGYRAIRDVVRGRLRRAAAIERIRSETRQYAKRQRTWFRHQLPADAVTLLDPLAPGATERAAAWWEQPGEA